MKKSLNSSVDLVKNLYIIQGYSMQAVATKLGMSMNAVTYLMRKNDIKRRSAQEASAELFKKKPLSFKEKKNLSSKQERLRISALMLYWAEGYKTITGNCVDFANSDPAMVTLFVNFMRTIYQVEEKRLRIYLYCYSNQNIPEIIQFWSKLTGIPKGQFSKPYVRSDFRENGRKMRYGMVHVRYADKKLFLCIMGAIESLKKELASIG